MSWLNGIFGVGNGGTGQQANTSPLPNPHAQQANIQQQNYGLQQANIQAIQTGFSNLYGQTGTVSLGQNQAIISTGTNWQWANPIYPPNHIFRTDMDKPEWTTPIAVLQDAWCARFGNEWVDKNGLRDEETLFFVVAAERLRQAGRLEEIRLVDENKDFVRVPE